MNNKGAQAQEGHEGKYNMKGRTVKSKGGRKEHLKWKKHTCKSLLKFHESRDHCRLYN